MSLYTSLRFCARWTVLALGAATVYAGAGGNDVSLSGVSPHGGAQPGEAAQSSASPVPTVPQQIELADPSLASTPQKRQQLSYLVQCALPADVELYTQQGSERLTFRGSIGLAPRWLSEALTPQEERWVSACLLARTNYFGKSILISMRATPPPVPTLVTSADEEQTFTIFEGGFFGNIFSPTPVAYTCLGERTPTQAADPILHDRVCTQATGTTTAAGKALTPCHFIVTGPCSDPQSFTVDGVSYAEVIFTHLQPRSHP